MMEKRAFNLKEIRIADASDEKSMPTIVGYAAVFNQWSEDLGGFRERIAPGAFADALKTDDVRALFNHNPDHILGRNIAGTLRLSEDSEGLRIEIDPPDTQVARDLIVSMRRGDITQMSFGFSVVMSDQIWEEKEDGTVERTIKRASLFDVSPVTYPAYPQTEVAVRSMNAWRDGKKKIDEGFQETIKRHSEILNLAFGHTDQT